MNAVTIKGRMNPIGIVRVLHDAIKINDTIKRRFVSDPGIYFISGCRFRWCPAAVVLRRRPIMAGDDRHANNLETGSVCAVNDLISALNDLRGGPVSTDVIGAHKQDNMRDPTVRQGVSGQTVRARRAGRWWTDVPSDRITANTFINDCLVCPVHRR